MSNNRLQPLNDPKSIYISCTFDAFVDYILERGEIKIKLTTIVEYILNNYHLFWEALNINVKDNSSTKKIQQ